MGVVLMLVQTSERVTVRVVHYVTTLPYPLIIQGTISVGIDATDLFDRYEEDFEEMPGGGFPHIEINRMHISQSIEVNKAI